MTVIISAACGPASAENTFRSNVRQICIFWGGTCTDGIPEDEEWVSMCIESLAEDLVTDVAEFGEPCVRKYKELFACAATWTCQEYLTFLDEHVGPCLDLETEFDQQCGDLSPFSGD